MLNKNTVLIYAITALGVVAMICICTISLMANDHGVIGAGLIGTFFLMVAGFIFTNFNQAHTQEKIDTAVALTAAKIDENANTVKAEAVHAATTIASKSQESVTKTIEEVREIGKALNGRMDERDEKIRDAAYNAGMLAAKAEAEALTNKLAEELSEREKRHDAANKEQIRINQQELAALKKQLADAELKAKQEPKP